MNSRHADYNIQFKTDHTVLYPRRPTTNVATVKNYVFVYGPWNGFAQPWYRVWPSLAVPSQPLQSHNDDWSTFTLALSARSRPSRNVTPLGAFEQSGETPVGFIMSVRPPFCLSIGFSARLSEYISSVPSAWISVNKWSGGLLWQSVEKILIWAKSDKRHRNFYMKIYLCFVVASEINPPYKHCCATMNIFIA
jgi:hypothetical protein